MRISDWSSDVCSSDLRVRMAFIASAGQIVSADYSQIELRVMAHVSGDENLRKAFSQGADIHRTTASEVFGVDQIGRASCRGRVCQYVSISGVAVSLKTKKKKSK